MVLVRLRLGRLERVLADRFNVSVSTVSQIWIIFFYLSLKELPLCPERQKIQSYMPRVVKELCPTTRVVIDVTKIFVETPALPEFEQMTVSSYKNHNTLMGISPGGAVAFISKSFQVLYLISN